MHHKAIRRAVHAALAAAPALPWPVRSRFDRDSRPPAIVIGAIVSDGELTKDGGGEGFWLIAVEAWVPTTSPLELDDMSAAIAGRLAGVAPQAPDGLEFSELIPDAEDEEVHPDAPGGQPLHSRTMTYRLLVSQA